MGTNFYLVICGLSPRELQTVAPYIPLELFRLIASYLSYGHGTIYHIGKRSGGSKIMFDIDFLRYWKKIQDSRWNKIVSVYNDIRERIYVEYPSILPLGVEEIDVWDLLSEPNVKIKDEYENTLPWKEFRKTVYDWNTWYSGCIRSQETHKYVAGSLCFVGFTNFT